ncbi:MAG TPA: hypothetical protein VFU47_14635 [Armatimonadota bacterium]|nr:hypothetical protein [Armatimonadota bacterium]
MPAVPKTEQLRLYETADQWYVLEIRGERDVPGYDPKQVGRGLSEQTYRREVLGDWTATTGKVVYPEYGEIHTAQEPLPFYSSLPLVCCWDFGGTPFSGTPAMVPTQVAPSGCWHIFPALVPPEDRTVGIYEFTEAAAEYLLTEFARPAGVGLDGLQLRHFGDPAGSARTGVPRGVSNNRIELRSCYEIIRDGLRVVVDWDERGEPVYQERPGWGWVIEPGEVSLTKRMEALRSRLTALRGGEPLVLVDSFPPETFRSPLLHPGAVLEGFQGGYSYRQRATGEYELDPDKNWYSHPLNALEYGASRLFAAAPPGGEEPEPVWQRTTRAAGRRKG